jgi:hypothetical protein
MWRHLFREKSTDDSEENAASTFIVKVKSQSRNQHVVVSKTKCMVYCSTLDLEAACSTETSVDFQWATRIYISNDKTLHNYRYKNL